SGSRFIAAYAARRRGADADVGSEPPTDPRLAALCHRARRWHRDWLGDLGLKEVVLCYHAVSPTWEHRLSISPDLLLRQVRLLRRVRRLRASFDDAFRSAATVFPELERLGVPV